MTDPLAEALALWGLAGADCTFVAGRENRVWRVRSARGDHALRLRRPGYRDEAELRSELDWLAALDRAGLQVPRPLPSRSGRLMERVGAGFADVLGWLPGRPLGQSRVPLVLEDRTGTYRALGAEIARLHAACDAWTPPPGFRRCRWDAEGLVGEAPVWGQFWDNPTLDPADRTLFLRLRDAARSRLAGTTADFGLIHADLVRENVLLDGGTIRLIDFDDGGFGYRLFDLATVLLKSLDEPDHPALRAALIAGYHELRPLDLSLLDLFIALRALTYVGWIVPRMAEPGGAARNARFVAEARALCTGWLQDNTARTGGGAA
ncbi:phosphotransferase enzyme family protein [Rhodobacter calidifons]|uniref:Phosphotransferase n=1 Tax=Rhodobacter calidifons TaxID=2715277 RepID=A0ABX0G530_9RHOB|nr:phosphotransferase [Rhodobacter calidifons]NHB76314.1 phosphotransferase [Rhodobacter calidifons]